MKTLIALIISLLSFTAASYSQKAAPPVPGNVKEALTRDFPNATDSRWMMEKDSYWVMFDENGIKRAVKYDKSGKWTEKQTKIEISDLPKEVTSSVDKNILGYTTYEAERVEMPNTDIRYNVDVMKGDEYLEIHVATDGKILSKVKKTTKSNWGNMSD